MIIGAVFRVFGIYTPLSGWVLLAINSVFGAATVPAIYEIAVRCFGGSSGRTEAGEPSPRGRKIALWSAWIWALYPATMQYSVRWIWETSLTTVLVAWVLVVTLRLRGTWRSERADGEWRLGLVDLLRPALGTDRPLQRDSAVIAAGLRGLGDCRGAPAAVERCWQRLLAGVVFALCLAPWTWRNWQVFHAFIPIRRNFGAELWVHNGPQDNGFPRGIVVFSQPELRSYASMGEVAYVRERGEWAKEYIRSHPRRFLRLSLERVYWFWMNLPHPLEDHPFSEAVREVTFGFLSVTGWLGLFLAIRRRIPGAWLFAAAFVLIPVTYYFVTVGARFRHPLEPLLVMLSVYLFSSAEPSFAVLTRR